MSILGKRQRWLAYFFGGLLAAIALFFVSMTLNQASAEATTNAWGVQTSVSISPRVMSESTSSHLEPNFYQ